MREFEYENQGSGSYLVYKVAPEEEVNTFILGMVTNNNIEGILKMSKVQVDGEIQVRYLISAKRQLQEYLKNEKLTKDIILELLYRIVQTIINAEEYMIRQNEFIMDINYMYVDINTKKPCIMCVPIKNKSNSKPEIDIFVKNLIYSIGYTDSEIIGIVNKIFSMINSCNGIVDFRDAIRREINAPQKTEGTKENIDIPQAKTEDKAVLAEDTKEESIEVKSKLPFDIPGVSIPETREEAKEKRSLFGIRFGREKKRQEKEAVTYKNENIVNNIVPIVPDSVRPSKQPVAYEVNNEEDTNTVFIDVNEANNNNPCLFRVNNNEYIEISKDYFKIGKSMTQVDYQIHNNNAISNFHAAILKRGCEYFIVDAGSTNHTYVEGLILEKNQEMRISDNTHIKMANEEFVFKLNRN